MPLGIGIGLKRRDDNGGGTVEPVPPYFINLLMPKDRSIYFGAYAISGEVGIPSGSGTELDPYLISNLEELLWVSGHPNSWNKWFKQTADINAYQTRFMNGGRGFSPIGNDNAGSEFCGNYNGQHYTISNLFIRRSSDHVGLFGLVKGEDSEGSYHSTLKGINLVNCEIQGDKNVGGIAGSVINLRYPTGTSYAVITECFASGSIKVVTNDYSEYGHVGGLCGSFFGHGATVIKSGANCSIEANHDREYSFRTIYAGGLIGYIGLAKIEDCYSRSNINLIKLNEDSKYGGLIGYSDGGDYSVNYLKRCYSTGRIILRDTLVTDCGFIGDEFSSSYSADNFWDTELSGATTSGGASEIGKTSEEMKTKTTFTNYSFKVGMTADIWNIGNNRNNLYPYLDWQYPDDPGYFVPAEVTTQATTDIELTTCTGNGTIVALGAGVTQHGHCWSTTQYPTPADSKTELGATSSIGAYTSSITGLTEGETYHIRAYIVSGGITHYGEDVTFTMYSIPVPELPAGSGTIGDPYLIANINNLVWLSDYTDYASYIPKMNKYYKQTADIDAYATKYMNSGLGFLPIGYRNSTNEKFAGRYVGNNKKISKLYINRPSSGQPVGLFGTIQTEKYVSVTGYRVANLELIDFNITGGTSVGAFCGTNTGDTGELTAFGITATGSVTGTDIVGGLIGTFNGNTSTIMNCGANCIVTGVHSVGGFIGSNSCTITNSYSLSTVYGTDSAVGGFAGIHSSDNIKDCYSMGNVTRTGGTYTDYGGFVGSANAAIKTSYSIGKVYFGETLQTDRGFSGSATGTYTNCIWDTEASGASTTLGTATGLTTTLMKDQATLELYSFSFLSNWNIAQLVNNGYAYLKWQDIEKNNSLYSVAGGTMDIQGSTRTITNLKVSKYPIQLGEWINLIGETPSWFKSSLSLPVDSVSFYDALVYCNLRSIAESKTPCYTISDSTNPNDWGAVPTSSNATWNAVTCDTNANGYRLPTSIEWEYIARGGQESDGYTYAGSNTIGDVAWYTDNSSGSTKEVGLKGVNELGIYDMSGNVYEWCFDLGGDTNRRAKGGAYDKSSSYCRSIDVISFDPSLRDTNKGLRVVTKGDV